MKIKEIGTIKRMDEQSGTSKAGKEWFKMTLVLEVETGFNSFANRAISVFGDDIADVREHQIGDKVEVSYYPNCREYDGRWFTELSFVGISSATESQKEKFVGGQSFPRKEKLAPAPVKEEESNDLPF